MVATTCLFRASITGLGVAAGTTTPTCAAASTFFRPISANVGTSGNCGRRVGLATASALTLPPLMKPAPAARSTIIAGT
ncbi:hypothetical protein D3C73_1601540 [compost metagenome]